MSINYLSGPRWSSGL